MLSAAAALPLAAVSPRAPPPLMSTVFSSRGFFVRAVSVGNSGLAPSTDPAVIVPLRHAELKHARLAMLAAVAVPMQELLHPQICSALACRDLLPDGLSTGLVERFPDPAIAPSLAFALVVMAAAEIQDIAKRMNQGLGFNEWAVDSVAGDMAWDPLRIATNLPATEKFELQEAEILNGRLAMLALAGSVTFEMLSGLPVISALA